MTQRKASKTPGIGRTGVRLQTRDLAILEALIERRCETLDYIHERFFPGLSRKRALNRLRDLQRAGWITRTEVALWDQNRFVSVYHLTRAAKPMLELQAVLGEHFQGRGFASLWQHVPLPKQIAVNRVGDWLGVQLLPEPLFTGAPDWRDHWSRPDAVYQAARRDSQGRDLVFVVVDLGVAMHDRVLGRVRAFLDEQTARSLLLISHNDDRAAIAARWVRKAFGEHVMREIQPLTFGQVREGGWLDPGTEPLAASRPESGSR